MSVGLGVRALKMLLAVTKSGADDAAVAAWREAVKGSRIGEARLISVLNKLDDGADLARAPKSVQAAIKRLESSNLNLRSIPALRSDDGLVAEFMPGWGRAVRGDTLDAIEGMLAQEAGQSFGGVDDALTQFIGRAQQIPSVAAAAPMTPMTPMAASAASAAGAAGGAAAGPGAFSRLSKMLGEAVKSKRSRAGVGAAAAAPTGKIGKADEWLKKFLSARMADARAHPVLTGLGAASLAPYALGGGWNMLEGLGNEYVPSMANARMEEMIGLRRSQREYQMLMQQMQQNLVNKTHSNMRMLAERAPHLYNELLANRRLPPDAAVFGGQQRQDILEEVAMDMSLGQV